MRAYSVFNASQIDGLPPHFYPNPVPEAPPTPSQKAAAIERFFAPVPADIRLGGDRAFYSPGADYIQLPHPNVFSTEDGFVATKAHEVCNIASVLISRTVDGLCALLFPNHRTACCAISGRES
jgi:antirestriction protein ArdC